MKTFFAWALARMPADLDDPAHVPLNAPSCSKDHEEKLINQVKIGIGILVQHKRPSGEMPLWSHPQKPRPGFRARSACDIASPYFGPYAHVSQSIVNWLPLQLHPAPHHNRSRIHTSSMKGTIAVLLLALCVASAQVSASGLVHVQCVLAHGLWHQRCLKVLF